MGAVQYTACSPCDIEDACGTLARPVAEKKELALPNYRREITGGKIANERADRAADYPPFLSPEPLPPRRPVALLESQTCRCQIVDNLDNIGIAHIEGQMVRH